MRNFKESVKIHDTAIIGEDVKLGPGVEIGPYSVIDGDVEIGKNTKIASHVQIAGWTKIGENNKIFNGVSLGLPPQHQDYDGEKTYLFIGDNNLIREYVTVHRGTVDGGGETRIGNDNLLMAYSHVAHDCSLANDIIMANAANLSGHVTIENEAYISGLVGVHQFVRIGRLAMIGAHSKATKDIPPFLEVKGHPAEVQGINVVGLRRHGIYNDLRDEIKKAYDILYNSSLNIGQAIEKMDQELKTGDEIEHFIRFLKSSSRGICR
ncbi:MAG: acyl-ACP--UDP-N-acetylglucosamine O-acyltransferase [Candidatus Woesearchaeota archaeon]